MKLSRRQALQIGTSAFILSATQYAYSAEAFPTHPVRVIVPFGAGGPVDVLGRLIAQKFSEHFGQQFFVENLGGAGGNIGTEKAAKAGGDGYTILITANNHVINPALYETVHYDPVKDFVPVSLAVGFPTALSVNKSVAAKDVKELVALIRSTPGKFSFASAGVGTPSHLLGEQFKQKLNLDIVHVPYNGSGPATEAVLAGDTQVCFRLTDGSGAARESRILGRTRNDEQSPIRGTARRADNRRSRFPGPRGSRLGRHFRPGGNATGHHRSAQRTNPSPSCRAGRRAADGSAGLRLGWLDTGRIRQTACH